MHVRVCLRVRTSQVVCFLDLDKCTIYGQDGNDLAIAMQVCVCVGGGGGNMCVTSRLHFHTRTQQWMGRSERSVVNLYRCLMNPQIKPLIKQV